MFPPCARNHPPPQIDTIDWMKDHINRLEDAILMERDAALV